MERVFFVARWTWVRVNSPVLLPSKGLGIILKGKLEAPHLYSGE